MKRLATILTFLLVIICLASCNKNTHVHKYDNGVVTTDAVCGGNKTIKYSCTECSHSYSKTYKVEHNWSKATCTEPKTCSICNETEGESLGHSYVENKCKRCSSTVTIDVTTPELSETVSLEIKNYFNYTKEDLTTATIVNGAVKITSIYFDYTASSDDNVKITFTVAGEKVHVDGLSDDTSTSLSFIYKLYDDEGFVVSTGTYTAPSLKVGEKFRDKTFTVSGLKNNESYTLVLVDYYTNR